MKLPLHKDPCFKQTVHELASRRRYRLERPEIKKLSHGLFDEKNCLFEDVLCNIAIFCGANLVPFSPKILTLGGPGGAGEASPGESREGVAKGTPGEPRGASG
jgi:hypothetical protein